MMMTSNAKRITDESRKITMTTRVKHRNELAAQKLAGAAMLIFVAIAVLIGGYFMAALVVAPFALAAVFSKEKVLDFGIFSNNVRRYR